MRITGLSIIILISFYLQACGTEVGNGFTWDFDRDEKQASRSEESPRSSVERDETIADDAMDDGIDNPGTTDAATLTEQIANTCASPGAYGANGRFVSESQEFTITALSDTMFSFMSGTKTIEAELNMGTEDLYDIEWTSESNVEFNCSEVNGGTTENPMWLVEAADRLTFILSWTVVNGEINTITINGEEFTKAEE